MLLQNPLSIWIVICQLFSNCGGFCFSSLMLALYIYIFHCNKTPNPMQYWSFFPFLFVIFIHFFTLIFHLLHSAPISRFIFQFCTHPAFTASQGSKHITYFNYIPDIIHTYLSTTIYSFCHILILFLTVRAQFVSLEHTINKYTKNILKYYIIQQNLFDIFSILC